MRVFWTMKKYLDALRNDKLIDILKQLGLGNDLSEEVALKMRVRQGYVLSHTLFNLYAEKIFGEALDDKSAGRVICDVRISNIRYARTLVADHSCLK